MTKKTPDMPDQGGSWERMLRARAVQNTAAEVQPVSEKELKIIVKRAKPAFLVPPLSWMIHPRLQRTIVLDQLGIEVWDLCDGRRSVETVVDEFARRHRLTFHEARVAVTEGMKLLVQRGALAIVE